MKQTFLVEIGTEELPAKILHNLIILFYENFINELKSCHIKYKKIDYFATPRRLALKILDIDTSEKTKIILKKGPSLKNAFNEDGNPTKFAHSWANHLGIKLNIAKKLKNEKGEWLVYYEKQKQEKIEILLPKMTEKALKKINVKNLMRWDENNSKFFRPIRNILMMLDDRKIDNKIFNINSTNKLHNHLSYKEKKIYLNHVQEYPFILFEHSYIIAEYEARKEKIKKEIKEIAKKMNGYIKINYSLLEEINSIVESPKAFLGTFEIDYIKCIPSEILIYIIEKQQKCFTIYKDEKILPNFIFITNITPKNNSHIIYGYEKVMKSRLSDILFFLKKDNQKKLLDYLPLLKKVLFYKNLGTLYDKTMRLKSLVNIISPNSNKANLTKAAILSKCDLITDMVCEFPDLQGIIGMYYALKNQEKYEIALSIKEQYLPSFSEDTLPSSIIGCILSIADKIDTLCGMFSINQIPLSNKDPFGLRRMTLGIIRIIINKKINLDLNFLIFNSLKIYNKINLDYILISNKIIKFFKLRLLSFYQKKGYNTKVIQSVLFSETTEILDIDQRIMAISDFKKQESSQSTFLIIKRVSNLLKIYNKDLNNIKININLMQKEEEKNLLKSIQKFKNDTKKLFIEKNYKIILSRLKKLENPINNFFNQVQINHDDLKIKNNRLVLLKKLEKIFLKIANFSFLY
ncbi:glycine--tRNA ligase subunit beta [Buchnera aphidicola]|nr:glycine--tRNA ligase subunit beta [Buchnera aphidicola]